MTEMMMTTQSPPAQRFMRERDGRISLRRAEGRRMVEPYRPLSAVLADGAWAGEPCFVIGGGPSLKGFDFERLRGRGKVIVINKGFVHVPFADVLFFMDHASFYVAMKRGVIGPDVWSKWLEFQGLRVFLNLRGRKVEDAYSVRSLGRTGLATSLARGLYHGNNSGYGALGLAMCLRADPIYLLGYDMKFDGRETHWHGGYHYRMGETVIRSFRASIDGLAKLICEKTAFRVINLNPDSALTGFPKMTPDEVLT